MAARGALGSLADVKAIVDLRGPATSAQNAAIRETPVEAIKSINAATPDSEETVPALRQQVIALERRQQELEDNLTKLQSHLKQLKADSPSSVDNKD